MGEGVVDVTRSVAAEVIASSPHHAENRGCHSEIRETHSAVVMLVGDVVYKAKKPIATGFLDFRDVESRRIACEREYLLNSRFAPDVYRGVAQLTDPTGGPSEPILVMDRLPDARRLSRLARAGEDVNRAVADIARILVRVHKKSEHAPRIDTEGTRDALRGRWSGNLAETTGLPDAAIPRATIDEIRRLADEFLDGRDALFAQRVSQQRIVDGHGDLLADDIFVMPDGVRILDCLDFDDRLRYVDVIDDACCLAMDLEFCGRIDLAESFIETVTDLSADDPPRSLIHHFIAYRAFVRAEVAVIRHVQGDPTAAEEARAHADIALAHLRAGRVTLTIIGGLPGSGKTTVTAGLGRRLHVDTISSDRVRKELAGLDPMTRCPSPFCDGLYSPNTTERTYDVVLHRAREALEHGRSVVIDASWNSAALRHRAHQLAIAAQARFVELECSAPESVSTSRIASRELSPSDATPEVYVAMAQCRDPWPTATVIDTGYLPQTAVDHAVAAVSRDLSPTPTP